MKKILEAAYAGDSALQIFLKTDNVTIIERSEKYRTAIVTNITTQMIIEDVTIFFNDCEPGNEKEKLAKFTQGILLVSFNFDLSSALWHDFDIIPYYLITEPFYIHCLFTSSVLFSHTPYSLSLPDKLVSDGGWISEYLYINNTCKIGYLIDRLRSLGNVNFKYGVMMKSSYAILRIMLREFSIHLLSNSGDETYDEIYILECDISFLTNAFLNRYGTSAKIFLLLTESDKPKLQEFESKCYVQYYHFLDQHRRLVLRSNSSNSK